MAAIARKMAEIFQEFAYLMLAHGVASRALKLLPKALVQSSVRPPMKEQAVLQPHSYTDGPRRPCALF